MGRCSQAPQLVWPWSCDKLYFGGGSRADHPAVWASPPGAAGISATEDSQIPNVFVATSKIRRETGNNNFQPESSRHKYMCPFQNTWCQCLKKKKLFEDFNSWGADNTTLRSYPTKCKYPVLQCWIPGVREGCHGPEALWGSTPLKAVERFSHSSLRFCINCPFMSSLFFSPVLVCSLLLTSPLTPFLATSPLDPSWL